MAFLVGVGITVLAVLAPGPAGVADPAGGGDATRARLRRPEHEAPRRRHGHDDRRGGDVPHRPARPAGRHARADRPRRWRRVAAVPRHGQRVVDRRQAGHQDDRLAGRQGLQGARSAGVRERRTGAAAHVGDGRRADDRRRPRQRLGRVRRLVAQHVRDGDGPRRHGRLGRHGRRVRPAPGRRLGDARRRPRAVGRVRRAQRVGA